MIRDLLTIGGTITVLWAAGCALGRLLERWERRRR